jgi:hypothetical protein
VSSDASPFHTQRDIHQLDWRTFPFVEEASIDILLLHIFANCRKKKKGYETETFTEATVHKKKGAGANTKTLVIWSATMKST